MIRRRYSSVLTLIKGDLMELAARKACVFGALVSKWSRAAGMSEEAVIGKVRMNSLRKDEFLAMLGHELRNPLAPIVNAVHVLRSESNAGRPTTAIS